jgi:THO complex subunit 4
MSGKLDQSLDDIVSTHRRGAGRGRGNRRARPTRSAAGTAAPAAPVGGIKKAVKPKPGAKVPTGPSGIRGDSKIMISNLVRTRRYVISGLC